jgi:hypothetical protein
MSDFIKISAKSYRDQGLDLRCLLEPHMARAAEVIKNYMVTFIVNEEPLGSGTIVKTCGVEGILTANHVAEELFKFSEFSLCVADSPHRLDISPNIIEHVPVGVAPKTSSPDEGPDLSFLIFRDAELVERLQTLKSFYTLDSVQSPTLPPILISRVIWGIAGTYYESFERIQENYEGGPLSKMTNFVGAGFFPCQTLQKEDFDYIRLTVPAGGGSKFPNDYHCMSGGGFWLLPMEIDSNGDPNTIGHRPPILAGVEFSQSSPENGERTLTGHGPHSIYIRMRQALMCMRQDGCNRI